MWARRKKSLCPSTFAHMKKQWHARLKTFRVLALARGREWKEKLSCKTCSKDGSTHQCQLYPKNCKEILENIQWGRTWELEKNAKQADKKISTTNLLDLLPIPDHFDTGKHDPIGIQFLWQSHLSEKLGNITGSLALSLPIKNEVLNCPTLGAASSPNDLSLHTSLYCLIYTIVLLGILGRSSWHWDFIIEIMKITP